MIWHKFGRHLFLGRGVRASARLDGYLVLLDKAGALARALSEDGFRRFSRLSVPNGQRRNVKRLSR